MDEPIVLVVDDDQHMRGSLSRLLKSIGLASKAFASADECLHHPEWPTLGCLILDVRMPGTNGLELQVELQRMGRELPTIVISGYAEVPAVVRAVKAGEIDFLEKPFKDQTLIDGVHRAIEVSRRQQLQDSHRANAEKRMASLSPRERMVAKLLVGGLSTKQVAAQLKISSKTVDIHRARILHKAQVESVVQLANLVHRFDIFATEGR